MAQQHNPSPHRVPNPIQVQKFLGGVDYPAGKTALVERARRQGADPEVMDALNRIPDEEYASPAAISRALGQLG